MESHEKKCAASPSQKGQLLEEDKGKSSSSIGPFDGNPNKINSVASAKISEEGSTPIIGDENASPSLYVGLRPDDNVVLTPSAENTIRHNQFNNSTAGNMSNDGNASFHESEQISQMNHMSGNSDHASILNFSTGLLGEGSEGETDKDAEKKTPCEEVENSPVAPLILFQRNRESSNMSKMLYLKPKSHFMTLEEVLLTMPNTEDPNEESSNKIYSNYGRPRKEYAQLVGLNPDGGNSNLRYREHRNLTALNTIRRNRSVLTLERRNRNFFRYMPNTVYFQYPRRDTESTFPNLLCMTEYNRIARELIAMAGSYPTINQDQHQHEYVFHQNLRSIPISTRSFPTSVSTGEESDEKEKANQGAATTGGEEITIDTQKEAEPSAEMEATRSSSVTLKDWRASSKSEKVTTRKRAACKVKKHEGPNENCDKEKEKRNASYGSMERLRPKRRRT